MSAEAAPKQSCEKYIGKIVLPQAVEDKSLIDSFTGFIHDVVPQAYSSSVPSENKEKILWARFESTDLNDPIFHSDALEPLSAGPPILLILGYSYGVQIWSISTNGEATELLSWFHGSPKFLKLLPTPASDQNLKSDPFAHRRPLVAIYDATTGSAGQLYSLLYVSLRVGDTVKSIKFKSPILDIAVNRISIIVSFVEKIYVFNALTLENSSSITTCYASPGYNLNPIALGSRWLAYSEQKLMSWMKSPGGCESESAPSYTATVLNAAKTLSQGLRDLSGSVANSLSGNLSTSPGANSYIHMAGGFHRSDSSSSINGSEGNQPGIVTIVDIKAKLSDDETEQKNNSVIAHFVAHPEPIMALCFDPSGVLLLTADKKGHRFHVFRIQPHLLGSSYTSVHHLYVLYRGDTSARVQDMTFSIDSRWVAVSSLRGTTHVFPVTPYGGPIGLRTHSTPHVVNKLSRFRRSAGIISDGRNSPVPHEVLPLSSSPTSMSFPNPCLPPFPHPTVITALAQIRNQSTLLPQTRHSSPQIQEENCQPALKVVACFAPPRLLDGLVTGHVTNSHRKSKNAVDSLFIMSSQGTLIQYDLEPLPASGIPKDKLCDESPIELKVETTVEWFLLQMPSTSTNAAAIQPPLNPSNPLLSTYSNLKQEISNYTAEEKSYQMDDDDKWLSQVEIVTHIGPHRRIWMGPQFTFKPILKNGSGDLENTEANIAYTAKSNPVNMPANYSKNQTVPLVPLYIESGSSSSLEQSPRLLETYGGDSDSSFGNEVLKIQEGIADAMLESPVNSVFKSGTNELSDSETVEETQEKHTSRKNRRAKKKRR